MRFKPINQDDLVRAEILLYGLVACALDKKPNSLWAECPRSRLFHNLIRTTQRPPGYVAHNISRDPGLVDCTVDLCVDKSSISTVGTNADTSVKL
eukprot:g75997.t1